MSTTPPNPRTQLRTLVTQLTEPTHRPIWRDNGRGGLTLATGNVPSLLDQLTDAVAPSGQSGGGGRSGGSPAGADLGALTLLRDIQSGLLDLHERAVRSLDLDDTERLRIIGQLVGQWESEQAIAQIVAALSLWTTLIQQYLDPPPRITLPGRCPACQARLAFRWDRAAGEMVSQRTLTVTLDDAGATVAAVECLTCRACWSTVEQLAQLNEYLDRAAAAQKLERRQLRYLRRRITEDAEPARRPVTMPDGSTCSLVRPERLFRSDDEWRTAAEEHFGDTAAAAIVDQLVTRYRHSTPSAPRPTARR